MNIMSKGIATETILYLLVGIIVVGILIFLVYKYVLTSQLSSDQCRGLMIGWCTTCNSVCTGDWSTCSGGTDPANVNGLTTCVSTYFGITLTSADKCKNHQADCKIFTATT
jgi:hypothetical protein